MPSATIIRTPQTILPLLLALALGTTLLPIANAKPHELTPETFATHIDSSTTKPLLLQFYAPWCGHCQRFAETYNSLSTSLQKTTTVARADGAAHRQLSQRFRISAFPTFFLITSGRVYEFTGPRTAAALTAFATSKGTEHGRPIDSLLGPLSIYWTGVAHIFTAVDALGTWIIEHDITPRRAALLALPSLLAILAVFALFIHVVTTPKPAPARPHAE